MTVNLLQKIKQDLTGRYTYDLPSLRYGRPSGIPVFLWDDLQDYVTMCSVLSQEAQAGYKFINSNVITKDNFLPMYNVGMKDTRYAAYCLSDPIDMVDLNLEDWALDDPAPIKGKLVGFSLRAILELDTFYKNEYLFGRQLITLTSATKTVGVPREFEAWAYFNEREDLADYDKERDMWVLKKNYDLLHFTKSKDNYYEM